MKHKVILACFSILIISCTTSMKADIKAQYVIEDLREEHNVNYRLQFFFNHAPVPKVAAQQGELIIAFDKRTVLSDKLREVLNQLSFPCIYKANRINEYFILAFKCPEESILYAEGTNTTLDIILQINTQ